MSVTAGSAVFSNVEHPSDASADLPFIDTEPVPPRIAAALQAMREGRPVVLQDDHDREDEADLIVAAERLTTETMALFIRECSGIVCLCLSDEKVRALELPPMVSHNESRNADNSVNITSLGPPTRDARLASIPARAPRVRRVPENVMHLPLTLVRDAQADDPAHGARAEGPFDSLEQLVGVNLARLRAERQLSLDALARASGVSRAMLAQVESARSVPSIKVLCKVAAALKVSVAAFLRRHAVNGFEHLPADRAKRVVSADGRYSARALFPDSEPSTAEFHELRISPLHTEYGERRAPGTTMNLAVSDGTLEVSVQDRRQLLATGDAIVFDADQPYSLRNPGDTEARVFRVTVNAETPPRWDVPPTTSDAARPTL